MKRISIKRIGFLLFVLIGLTLPCGVIPKNSLTAGKMHAMKRAIHLYCVEHGMPPKSLDDLSFPDGRSNSPKDAWGRRIDYKVTNGVVELRSYGSDKKPGGEGRREDITGTFSLKDADGKWADKFSEWTVRPSRFN